MIIFNRTLGTLTSAAQAKAAVGIWSGHGDAANDPSRESEHGIGPLPRNKYRMHPPRDGGHLGPFVIDLEPFPGVNMFGRSLLRIHGDTVNDVNHAASDGCIIAARAVREWCATEPDHLLEVL